MIARAARWLIVRAAAFSMRHGVSAGDVLTTLARSHPHQTPDWRMELVNDATIRNMRRRKPVA